MFQWVNLCWKGTTDETWDGLWLVTWRCQLIPALVSLLWFRWLPPGFPGKKSAFLMPSSSQKVRNWKYWELLMTWASWCAWAVGNLSLHSSLCPERCPGVRQLQLHSKEDGSPGQIPIYMLQSFAQMCSKWLVSQQLFSLKTRTAMVKNSDRPEMLNSHLCSACTGTLPSKLACPQHPYLMK